MKLAVIQYFDFEQVRLDLYSSTCRSSNESVFYCFIVYVSLSVTFSLVKD